MKIYMKGFKSIKDGQRVALGKKLTFLVGPNSAGKSAVLLALQKLKGDRPEFILESSQIYRNPNKDSEISLVHALGIEWESNGESLGYYSSYLPEEAAIFTDKNHSDELLNTTNIHELGYAIKTDEFNNSPIRLVTSQNINGIPMVLTGGLDKPDSATERRTTRLSLAKTIKRFQEGSKHFIISLNPLDTKLAIKLTEPLKWFASELDTYIKEEEAELVKYESNEVKTDASKDYFNKLKKLSIERYRSISEEITFHIQGDVIKWDEESTRLILYALFKGKRRQQSLNIFEKHNATIRSYIKSIDNKFCSNYPGKLFDVSLVSAGRTLPSESDTDTLINFSKSDNVFHELMKSQIIEKWDGTHGIDLESSHPHSFKEMGLLESINKALSENLFIDNAYHVQIESKIIASHQNWTSKEFSEDEIPEFIGKMFLMDSHGRKLNFDEVGSGIGYVLPVLIESLKPSNKNRVVFLQQPELHLHPALQASLTDVLIEASSSKKIVAETHSEHMILRALKRVRQTANGSLKDPELKLSAEDIAVNYFEPMSDGSTRVHILRVSDDGDFLDRWPNGFFAERDQELFDE